MGLNPEAGANFVAVYLVEIHVFSETFEVHLLHLRQVLEHFKVTGLKLTPSKCYFIFQYGILGHLITPQGISQNLN